MASMEFRTVMVIDTSAIVAILRNEPDAVAGTNPRCDRIRLVPATCVLEVRMVMVSRRGDMR
jgi:ribonuclease VapC